MVVPVSLQPTSFSHYAAVYGHSRGRRLYDTFGRDFYGAYVANYVYTTVRKCDFDPHEGNAAQSSTLFETFACYRTIVIQP